ncbi:FtsH protease activity modulator HflK [Pseudoduganella sp. DS3]|uniref:Protein HflK n=1 Tax=Pseudoduganella guangdongensis TaxID=2692179 RepID=A0A6N9HMC2_9BURK|nr:FtsH protease activity modulator HflK [Pseudoduganella guangdongensis]MYN04427.1 FtsH protease activity modulator HflK [Pseudoduganella guangdongensis]
MPFSSLKKRLGLKLSLNDHNWGNDKDKDKDNRKAQEGKKPGEGPPDLDQLWRDFNQRLNGLFGGGKNRGNGGGGGGGGGDNMKGAGITFGAVASVAALVWLASGAFIVQEGQTGVVTTFGKFSHETPAGFNWRWPYPFQNNETVNVSTVRTVEVGYRGSAKTKMASEALMLTEDENIIDIQFAVQYKVKKAFDWLYSNRDAEDTVRQVAETAIREVVGRSKMDFVLYEGREKVANDTQALMQSILDRYNSGAQVTNVTMQGVQPPEQVQAAFDDAVKAGQDRERQKNEGQAYANDIVPKARGAAFRLIQEAEAYRAQSVQNATGNADRFKSVLAEYQKAPAVTRDRMYIDTMQQIFANTSKVMVDSKAGSNLLYLPLDKLIAQVAATEGRAASVTAQPPTAVLLPEPTTDTSRRDSRSRESSRDREGR